MSKSAFQYANEDMSRHLSSARLAVDNLAQEVARAERCNDQLMLSSTTLIRAFNLSQDIAVLLDELAQAHSQRRREEGV
jgi:hypothetical protein